MKRSLVIALIVSILLIVAVLISIFKIVSYVANEERIENCARAGEYLPSGLAIATEDTKTKCCEGLKAFPTERYDENDGKCYMTTDPSMVCSDCGNGNCEKWENPCNCKEDCAIAID